MALFSKARGLLLAALLVLSIAAACAAQEKKKIAYGVFVDNSGSMRSQFQQVIGIAKAVTRQVRERGPVSIFDFHSLGTLQRGRAVAIARVEQTQNERTLEQTIDDVYVEGGLTTLLDAIQTIATGLDQQASGFDKVIVLITDGEDRASKVKPKQLIQELKDLKIRVYAVGLVEKLDSEGGFSHPGARSKAIDFLNSVTKENRRPGCFSQVD